MKKLSVIAASALVAVSLSACGKSGDVPSTSHVQSSQDSAKQINEKKPTIAERRKEIADTFITTYNGNNDPDVTDVSYYDPQDKESEYYRPEFRLGAWKNSVGLHGACGNCIIDLTVYRGDQVRVYASGPLDEIESMFGNLVRAFDSNVSEEQIAEAIDKAENQIGGGNGLRIDGSSIEPMLFFVKGESAEIMIDGKIEAQ